MNGESEPTALAGGVAAITGAASGIGAALARVAVDLGMRVALCDVQEEPLAALAAELTAQGADVFACRADVASWADIEAFAEQIYARWEMTTMLFNNAAIMLHGNTWESVPADWGRAVRVSLDGVFHGVRAFVPRMLGQEGPAHVVNIASVGALRISRHRSSYIAAKHACLALTEAVAGELTEVTDRIKLTAVMPGPVRTAIFRSAKSADIDGVGARQTEASIANLEANGMDPEDAARIIIDGARRGRLRVHTHPQLSRGLIDDRYRALLEDLS